MVSRPPVSANYFIHQISSSGWTRSVEEEAQLRHTQAILH